MQVCKILASCAAFFIKLLIDVLFESQTVHEEREIRHKKEAKRILGGDIGEFQDYTYTQVIEDK